MVRNDAADRFVDCVVRRGESDTYLKPILIIASMIIPLVFGTVYAMMSSFSLSELWDMFRSGADAVPMFGIYVACITEAILISFFMLYLTRRNSKHLKRDVVWMESLCDYVDSHGGITDSMRSNMKETKGQVKGIALGLSTIIWVVLVVLLVIIGLYAWKSDPSTGSVEMFGLSLMSIVPIVLLILIQFLATLGAVFLFPATHDRAQTEFTSELRKQCSAFGLDIPEMGNTVRRRDLAIHILLTIITIGFYSPIYLVISCRAMNRHLESQWGYEEHIMGRIIEFEGGTGVESISKKRFKKESQAE